MTAAKVVKFPTGEQEIIEDSDARRARVAESFAVADRLTELADNLEKEANEYRRAAEVVNRLIEQNDMLTDEQFQAIYATISGASA